MRPKQVATIFTVALLGIFLLLFIFRSFYGLKPGERGIVFHTISGKLDRDKIVGPGLKIIAPWNELYRYDVKEQTSEETLDILDRNGLSINVDVTIRYNPAYDRIAFLHETFGIGYKVTLIIPELRSTFRRVAGRYTAEEIYSTKRDEIEQTIIRETGEILLKNNVEMKALLIRSINLPTDIKMAIESKLTREQEALAMKFINEKERLEADRKKIEAEGISSYNKIISESLTDRILKQKGIDATLVLAASANAKVVVIGSGKDGMPLILGGN
ncbi:MAG: prohibitin family protein [Bacteroidales bacterium]|nr:prohibitin family protein [Bacteroidales bacterium]